MKARERGVLTRSLATLVLAGALGVALPACSRSIDLSKSNSQMRVGTDMARKGLWREARFRFQRAVEIDPANAQALSDLAVAYEGTGEFEKAREAYVEALRLDRGNPYIQKNYSRFVEFYNKYQKRQTLVPEVKEATAGEELEAGDDSPPPSAEDIPEPVVPELPEPTSPEPEVPATPPAGSADPSKPSGGAR